MRTRRRRGGVTNRKEHPSRVEPPDSAPRLITDTETRWRIIIYYADEKSGRCGKTERVHGIEVCRAILDHYPPGKAELIHSAFDTNPPLTLEFDEADRGKRLYLFGRWDISREGEKGSGSAIVEAVIP